MEVLITAALVIGGLVAVTLVLVALAMLIGARLPVAHRARRSVEVPAPIDRVWEQVADESWVRSDTRFETVEARQPLRIVRRVVGETAFGGTWTLDLEPAGTDRTRLTITEDGEVYNTFYRFVSLYVIGHHRGIDGYIGALRTRLTGAGRPT